MGRWKTVDTFAGPMILEIRRDAGGTADSYNQEPESLSTVASIRASVTWQSGAESTEAGAQRKLQSGIVKARHYEDISESDTLRIKGTTRVFNIDWIHRLEETPHLMEIHVTERK